VSASVVLDHVSCGYAAHAAVIQDVSLELQPGAVTALVGPNGAGKSTLLKAMLGLLRLSGGSVHICGETPPVARKRGLVGYVPQSELVDWDFPIDVATVAMMGRSAHQGSTRRPRRADREAVDAALEVVDLTHLRRRQIGRLSGGQRKRAFIARCLAQHPTVMLLDEPFAGVDRASQELIIDVLRAERQRDVSTFVSTHELATVPEFCDEVVVLDQHVLLSGEPREVLTVEHMGIVFGGRRAQVSMLEFA
jgi:manganese transport system ATP-binding protein